MATLNQLLKGMFILSTILFSHMCVSAKKRNVIRHNLKIESKGTSNDKLKIFFISDIHRRKIDRKLLKKIDKDIDLVIMGGDLAERNVSLSRISNNIQSLSKIGPLFFVWGNNDREAGEWEIRNIISRHNGVILDNENCPVPNHPEWGICGTDDPSNENVDIEAALQGITQYERSIFISHQPCVWSEVESLCEPTLMLAGHTHGGQIRVGKYGIAQKGFFRQSEGRGKLLSNGYGTTKIPLRLGAPAASHIITVSIRK